MVEPFSYSWEYRALPKLVYSDGQVLLDADSGHVDEVAAIPYGPAGLEDRDLCIKALGQVRLP
jgi:hypothetical protein